MVSSIGKQLAERYGGDLASIDWRHLGRLAGFANQKPQHRDSRGHAPWVKVLYAHLGFGGAGRALHQAAQRGSSGPSKRALAPPTHEPLTNIDSFVSAGTAPNTQTESC